MGHLYINLDIKKIGQFIESIEYTTKMGEQDKTLYYLKKLREYIDYRSAQTAFQQGEKDGKSNVVKDI